MTPRILTATPTHIVRHDGPYVIAPVFVNGVGNEKLSATSVTFAVDAGSTAGREPAQLSLTGAAWYG